MPLLPPGEAAPPSAAAPLPPPASPLSPPSPPRPKPQPLVPSSSLHSSPPSSGSPRFTTDARRPSAPCSPKTTTAGLPFSLSEKPEPSAEPHEAAGHLPSPHLLPPPHRRRFLAAPPRAPPLLCPISMGAAPRSHGQPSLQATSQPATSPSSPSLPGSLQPELLPSSQQPPWMPPLLLLQAAGIHAHRCRPSHHWTQRPSTAALSSLVQPPRPAILLSVFPMTKCQAPSLTAHPPCSIPHLTTSTSWFLQGRRLQAPLPLALFPSLPTSPSPLARCQSHHCRPPSFFLSSLQDTGILLLLLLTDHPRHFECHHPPTALHGCRLLLSTSQRPIQHCS